MNKVLVSAVKELLVAVSTGEDISNRLSKLERAMELAEPGWCVADELRKRYKPEKNDEEEDHP